MIKIGSILIIISSFVFAQVTASVDSLHPTERAISDL